MSAPESPASPYLGAAPTVTRILRDAPNRAIIATLGEAKGRVLDITDLQSRALPDAPSRFLRDRLRVLAELGVTERVAEPGRAPGATSSWTLTPAGLDLHRLYAVVSRIVIRAGAPNLAATPLRGERAVEAALDGLADPAILRVIACLAAADAPLAPDALEELCRPVTRRTLYRRLRTLQDDGLVNRLVTHEVPRRTHYALNDRWRPVAGVLLLAAWWELRHGREGGASLDLPTLLHLVAPVSKAPKELHGTTNWSIDEQGDSTVRVSLSGGSLRVSTAPAEPADATLAAPALAWAAALVGDDRSGLRISGDARLADAAIRSARAALLAYVR